MPDIWDHNRKPGTFWVTTGLFPHEVVISFSGLMDLQSISITSYNGTPPALPSLHTRLPSICIWETSLLCYLCMTCISYYSRLLFRSVRRLQIEKSGQSTPNGFEMLESREFPEQAEDVLQVRSMSSFISESVEILLFRQMDFAKVAFFLIISFDSFSLPVIRCFTHWVNAYCES